MASDLNSVLKKYLATLGKNEASAAEVAKSVRTWVVENGEIAYPVHEITIAGNLAQMFKQIVAVGADQYTTGSKTVGSVLIESMMIAGS